MSNTNATISAENSNSSEIQQSDLSQRKVVLFESTIEEIKVKQKSLLFQIWFFGGFSISIILGILYRVFTSQLFNKHDTGYSIHIEVLTSITVLVALSMLIWYLNRLNTLRQSLTNKLIAISTFSDIQSILRSDNPDNNEPSFEYRASIKRFLDTLNDLAQTTK